jgi:enoyl-CoA hydratase
LEITVNEGLATVALDRPETGNRVDEGMAAELREVASEVTADNGIRVVILTGNGPVFSTGRKTAPTIETIKELQASNAIAGIKVPVVVALNGDATDQGLELALGGDIRLAVANGNFGFAAPSGGGFPFDGGTQRLPRLVGPGWASDMLLTGRMISAEEALSIGLVNRVAGSGENVLRLARELATDIMEGSPLGARYAKEAVNSGTDLTLSQGLVLETDLNVILQSTADRAEGIASFLERRSPSFEGE